MKKFIGIAIFVGILLAFYKLGRKIWYPVLLKLKGRKTIDEVVKNLEANVKLRLKDDFAKCDLTTFPEKILLVGIKSLQKLQLWAKTDQGYKLIKTYNFTAFSGKLGPKLREGDRQIPEGVYKIEYLNPNSSYHLSMKLNYPNEFDLQKAKQEGRANPGSDIMIHGREVTIGCIPIGDAGIEEVFICVARAGIANVDVIVSPFPFDELPGHDLSFAGISWYKELCQTIHNKAYEMGLVYSDWK
jgi:L,D-peptidoglycan transpeptidase YkuD (ErfK/YbiS/YcfS/YnhG family)